MRSRHLILGLALAGATLALSRGPVQPSSVPGLTAHIRTEAARLQAHFDRVDGELRERDLAALSPAQGAVRSTLIEWLRDYRHAARFPLNDGVSGEPVPIFRDSRGVLCAMAYLIDRSGRRDIVDRVAGTNNTARLVDLTSDPALVAWLAWAGLSVEEGQRIQPTYGGWGLVEERKDVSAAYAIASVLTSGSALIATTVNVTSPSTTSGILGLVLGLGAGVAGAVKLDEGGEVRALGALNMAIGATSMVLGANALLRQGDREARPAPGLDQPGLASRFRVGPGILVADRPRLAVVLRASF